MAGVAYDINSKWTADLGYKYADLGRVRKHEGANVGKIALRDHEILLGIRYNF
jgi:opacity protein-like surface antigen